MCVCVCVCVRQRERLLPLSLEHVPLGQGDTSSLCPQPHTQRISLKCTSSIPFSPGSKGPNHFGQAFPRAQHSCRRTDLGEAFPASLPHGQSRHLWASYLGLSAGLEAGAVAEAVAAWAAAVAGGGEAVLGEAAAGDWAEAGSSGVAAWLVHTGACSIGVLMRRPRKTTGQGSHSAGGARWVQQRQAGQKSPALL